MFGVKVVDLEEEMRRIERRAWKNEERSQLMLENIANRNHHQGAEAFIDIPIAGDAPNGGANDAPPACSDAPQPQYC